MDDETITAKEFAKKLPTVCFVALILSALFYYCFHLLVGLPLLFLPQTKIVTFAVPVLVFALLMSLVVFVIKQKFCKRKIDRLLSYGILVALGFHLTIIFWFSEKFQAFCILPFLFSAALSMGSSILEEKEVKYEKEKNETFKAHRLFIFFSIFLAALCLFFTLRPSPASNVPASTPAVTTTQAVTRTSGQYVASVNSNKFHRTSCRHAQDILNENRVYYDTVTEAEDDGKEPCSICRP